MFGFLSLIVDVICVEHGCMVVTRVLSQWSGADFNVRHRL